VDPAIREMARRLFGFRNFNPLASSRELVGILERAVARRAKAQKARAREEPYWIRGKVGYLRVVFYGVGSRQYARNYVVPRDPRTRHQERARGRMGAVSAAWGRRLSAEQRGAWNAAAAQELSRRRPQAGLTGQTLFVRHNSVLELAGREWALWPPGRVVFGENPVQGLRVGQGNPKPETRNPKAGRRKPNGVESRNPNGDEGWRVELEVAGPVEHDILIFGEKAAPAGRTRPRHPVYLGVVAAGTGGGVWDITDWYVGRLGAPGAGQRVFICAQQQRDGWRDGGKVLSDVVLARVEAEGRGVKEEGRRQKAEGRTAARGCRTGMRRVRIEYGAYVDGVAPMCMRKRAERAALGQSRYSRAGGGGAGGGQGGVFWGRTGRRRGWRGS
ncbi:MAG: hypothetical protein ABSD29_22950, partial [Verrucomicrobiota bacterium]